MGRGGGRGVFSFKVDREALRAQNAAAPRIPHLGRRVSALFRPHLVPLIVTGALVVLAAAIAVIPPLIVRHVFDEGLFPPGGGGPNVGVTVTLVAQMIGLAILGGAITIAQTKLTSSVGNEVMGELRVSMFSHLQSMELAFFTRTRTGVIQSRLQNDVGGVASVLTNTVTSVLGSIVTVVASLVAMLLIDWRLTIIAVGITPVLVVINTRVGQIRARIAAETQDSLAELTAITQETLSVSGVLLAKSFNRQHDEVDRYQAENRRQIRLQVRQAMSGQWFFGSVNILMSSIPAVIYLAAAWVMAGGIGATSSASAPLITAGTIVAFTTVQARLLFPLMSLMRVGLDLQTSGALFARIFEYLDLKSQIEDAPTPVRLEGPDDEVGRIEFDAVSFRYPGAAETTVPTLSEVSFIAEPGKHVAFVGPSGGGKTTILSLIPRMYDVTSGAVLVGGYDVRALGHESLIDHIGIVSQETYLFHASILENLRYAKPGATMREIVDACRSANIHDAIESFEDGYETIVGERGYRLSGGEKQRIAIARVLLKDPPILLLDEATSALDTVSERVVQHALDAAVRGRTTITVAHRLSTIVQADRIHVVAGGRIVESGTHAELLALNGAYMALAAEQAALG